MRLVATKQSNAFLSLLLHELFPKEKAILLMHDKALWLKVDTTVGAINWRIQSSPQIQLASRWLNCWFLHFCNGPLWQLFSYMLDFPSFRAFLLVRFDRALAILATAYVTDHRLFLLCERSGVSVRCSGLLRLCTRHNVRQKAIWYDATTTLLTWYQDSFLYLALELL